LILPILREACFQAYPESAICVQRFDDSLSSAIRITYRISLRSSSLREPRYPLLRVVCVFSYFLMFHHRNTSDLTMQTRSINRKCTIEPSTTVRGRTSFLEKGQKLMTYTSVSLTYKTHSTQICYKRNSNQGT
jgi:hypothetical protein